MPGKNQEETGLSLIGNVLKQLAEIVLNIFWVTATAGTTDAAIHKKCFDQVLQH